MMYGSSDHRHKQHHAQQYQSRDSSNGYPFFAKRGPEGQQDPFGYGSPIFNNYQEFVLEDPRRIPPIDYEPASVHVPVKSNDQKVEENVDTEAEEFIRFEHKKFQLSKLKSVKSG